MVAAFKALWEAVSWWLTGVLGLRRFSFPLDKALIRFGELDWAVWGKLTPRVFWAVSDDIVAPRNRFFGRVFDSAADEDPPHPALHDFLREVGFEA